MRKNLKLLSYKAIGIGVTLLPILIYTLFRPSKTRAEWFNDAWQYRQKITFTHNADISSERAITFSLDTAELISAGVMQSDCDDTRFTDHKGQLLRFQLTGTCNNAATSYEVVFPTIVNGSTVGYVYYGNPGASSASVDVSGVTALTPSGGDPAITDRVNEEKTTGPLSYWAMDEGTDNTCPGGSDDVCDATTHTYGGARTGATWTAEDRCKTGNCLEFDGTDDTINVGNETLLNLERTSSFSVQFWMRAGTDAGMTLVSKQESSGNFRGWNIQTGTSGYIYFQFVNTYSSNTLEVRTTNDTNYDDNRWHHVLVTYDGSSTPGGVKIYFDGADQSLTTVVNTLSATTQSATNVHIGSRNGATQFFNGFLDDVKVYNYVRSAAQSKTDFASQGAVRGVSARFGQRDTAFLNDGLVGYWKADEASGNMSDSSGNGTTLTDTNTVAFVGGKFGNAGDFELGNSEYQYAADNAALSITGSLTLSAWIRPETISAGSYNIIAKWDGTNESYRLFQNGDEIRLELDSAGNYVETTASNLAVSTYYQVTATYVAATAKIFINGEMATTATTGTIPTAIGDDAGRVHIGAEDSTGGAAGYYDGYIDEARIYNRALSPVEVRALYTWAPGSLL